MYTKSEMDEKEKIKLLEEMMGENLNNTDEYGDIQNIDELRQQIEDLKEQIEEKDEIISTLEKNDSLDKLSELTLYQDASSFQNRGTGAGYNLLERNINIKCDNEEIKQFSDLPIYQIKLIQTKDVIFTFTTTAVSSSNTKQLNRLKIYKYE